MTKSDNFCLLCCYFFKTTLSGLLNWDMYGAFKIWICRFGRPSHRGASKSDSLHSDSIWCSSFLITLKSANESTSFLFFKNYPFGIVGDLISSRGLLFLFNTESFWFCKFDFDFFGLLGSREKQESWRAGSKQSLSLLSSDNFSSPPQLSRIADKIWSAFIIFSWECFRKLLFCLIELETRSPKGAKLFFPIWI